MPGEPTQRQLYARQVYLEMGAGRSLVKLMDELNRRRQRDGKPAVCTRLRTLERWCSEGNWAVDAIQYDVEQAARRSEFLAEQERQQAEQDVKTLAGTIRGAVAISAVVLNTYTDQQGNLARRDATLRDVGVLLKLALDALRVIHPGHDPHQPPRYEVQQLLTQGTPQQRVRALHAMHELDAVLGEFGGER